MIQNTIIVKQSDRILYTITDNTPNGCEAPSAAPAGSRIIFDNTEKNGGFSGIADADGNVVPYGIGVTLPDGTLTRTPSIGYGFFIMPASDVTIS